MSGGAVELKAVDMNNPTMREEMQATIRYLRAAMRQSDMWPADRLSAQAQALEAVGRLWSVLS